MATCWSGRATGAIALALACSPVAPAAAQVPSLPPVGQPPPPPGQQPQPEPQPPAPPPVSPAPGSVTERVDVAQTGFFPDDTLVPPLAKRWTIEARGELILAADGRVYLIGFHQMMAVSQADGKQIWSNATETLPVGAAYDNGLLFVTEGDYVRAFNAQTGGQVWQAKLTDVAGPGAPVASGGVVYVTHAQGGSQLHAFRASDGQEPWKVAGVSGERSPALDDGRVYLSGACGNAAAYDRRDGSVIWRHKTGCSGGGDFTPALRSGRLWSPDKDDVNGMSADAAVLDAAGGNVVAHHPGGTPLFVDEFGIRSQEEEGITAFNAATGATAWQKKGANTARIAIGHDVYGVTDTRSGGEPSVAAFDSESGDQVWSDGLGSNQASTGSYVSFGAAPGLLIVANNGNVTAYESVFKPAAGGIELGAEPFDAVAGAHISLGGVLGSSLRGTRPAVQVQAAPWRRGSFKGIGGLKPARDGYFSGLTQLDRNVRYRASAGGATSDPITVYASPSVRLGRARPAGRRIRVGVTAKAPGARLAGRRFVLYLDRGGDNKGLRRLAGARLRGGRRSRATLLFAPLSHLGRRDTIVYCIRGQLGMSLGRPSPLTRRCGARSLRVG